MKTVELGSVATIERNGVDPSAVAPDTFYLGLEHIERGGRIIGHGTVGGAELASTKFQFTPDHVLFGKLRPNLGKISRPCFAGVCSTDILPIRPGRDLDRNYLAHYLAQPSMIAFAASRTSGANLPRLSPTVLATFPVPLPPLPEQRRIAAILDHADSLRAKRRRTLSDLDGLTESIFHQMFGDESWRAVTPSLRPADSHGWQWELLTDVATLATGHTPDRKRQEYWGGNISWISLPAIRELDGRCVTQTDVRVTEAGIANSSAVVLPQGTVCFSRTASVGFVTKMGRPMATSQDFHNWVPGPRLHSDYLMHALRFSRQHLLGASDGSIHKTIYQRVAERFRVLMPPFALQHQFADRVGFIERVRVRTQCALAVDNELFASLQSRAFRGGL